MGTNIPGGGKIILCGGDFRQCAPIVENGTTEEIIAISVCCSPLWNRFTKFKLTENVRALLHETEFKEFSVKVKWFFIAFYNLYFEIQHRYVIVITRH
uniref:ATP-dependent DNA helicase n=1 Tax=Panagrolaimus davidi TaxID=227884 RepID=A0A914QKT1_9BILA